MEGPEGTEGEIQTRVSEGKPTALEGASEVSSSPPPRSARPWDLPEGGSLPAAPPSFPPPRLPVQLPPPSPPRLQIPTASADPLVSRSSLPRQACVDLCVSPQPPWVPACSYNRHPCVSPRPPQLPTRPYSPDMASMGSPQQPRSLTSPQSPCVPSSSARPHGPCGPPTSRPRPVPKPGSCALASAAAMFWAKDMAAPDTSAWLLWVLLRAQAKLTRRKQRFYRFLFIFKGGEKKNITFKLQLNWVFNVVLMY